jgi:spectinomycin phosphotransferase
MLDQFLAEQYGFGKVTLTPAPRGFIAETYYVDTDSGRYFAKLVKVSRDSQIVEQSLPVLHELHQLGVDHIIYPILTTGGQFSVEIDGKILALFNHVPGEWVFDYPFELYLRLLGQIHQISERIQTPLTREDFSLPFRDELLTALEQVWSGTYAHPAEKDLQQWCIDHRAEIERDFPLMEQAAAELRAQEHTFILTHGDAPGNVLYDGKDIYLVDWDMVLFAPRERDTWFHMGEPQFLPLYRAFVPGYEFDRTAYRFYLYKRYFEDLLGYIEKVLSPESTDEDKRRNVIELYETCAEWLRPPMDADRLA